MEIFLTTVICPKQRCEINNFALLPDRKKKHALEVDLGGMKSIRQVENVTFKHSILWSKCRTLLKGNLGSSTKSQEPWDWLCFQILLFSLFW